MLKKISFFGLIALFIGINSCETDFSLNGDYELTPVVFGLLDQNDSIHRIKITKAFLGDGDNLVYAQNPDSSYFAQVDARVIEYDDKGDETGREWQLFDSIVTNKETDGVFYAPDQKIYYFVEPNLESSYTYEITADINEGAHSFTATTSLIDGFKVPNTLTISNFKVRFAKNTVDEDKDYLSWVFDPTFGENAAEYDLGYTFHWTEHYLDGTEASFEKRRFLYSEDDLDRSVIIGGLDFFQWVADNVPDDPEVDFRTSDGIDLHISVAHSNLTQYMNVSDPVTGIAQVQPIYTNVDGGYGLFSSRLLYTLEGLPLDEASTKELARGSFTITKLFCSNYGLHDGEDFACE